jgi:hypothetical protein
MASQTNIEQRCVIKYFVKVNQKCNKVYENLRNVMLMLMLSSEIGDTLNMENTSLKNIKEIKFCNKNPETLLMLCMRSNMLKVKT